MPKNRRRRVLSGAKSIAIRTKNKIGGRKSGRGTGQMSDQEFQEAVRTCRKRDRNKLRRAWEQRGVRTEHLDTYFQLTQLAELNSLKRKG